MKRNIEDYTKLAEIVRKLFISNAKEGLWIEDAVETLKKSKCRVIKSQKDLKSTIIELA